MEHIPILFGEVMEVLKPQPGETVLDLTLGLGGHAAGFLQRTAPDGQLIAFDADRQNLEEAKKRLTPFGGRASYHHANFQTLSGLLPLKADIVFADLGLSSPHLDEPERGFSFKAEGPLDMRFDRTKGETAEDILQRIDDKELARIFRTYGEIDDAGRIADVILTELKGKTGLTTTHLRQATEKAVGHRAVKILPQIFQALRITINGELDAVHQLLRLLPEILPKGGRAGIITFHSLEDRLVKTAFRSLTTAIKDDVTGAIAMPAEFEMLTKKGIAPSEKEVQENPRSRSARFRAIRRVV